MLSRAEQSFLNAAKMTSVLKTFRANSAFASCSKLPPVIRSQSSSAKQNVIFSGIQPTGTPHLGNYLGLFLPFLEMQASAPATTPIYLSIVGLHAITLPQDPAALVRDRRDMLASLLACGVDPERTCVFFQEDVREHTELAWHLNCMTPVGRLQRMTTWKSRLATSRNASSETEVNDSDLKLGLLSYPVLQAADILLYKSTDVPVGEDQLQHLELSRDIAEIANRLYGPIFPLPAHRIVPSKRVLSLRDPTQKMSKSAPNAQSRILITDTPEAIQAKLKGAVTDSNREITYDPEGRPGISNLLTIWSALDWDRGRTPEQLAADCRGIGAGKLKGLIGEVVSEALEPVRTEYERIREDHAYLSQVAKKGRETARAKAAETMEQVRKAAGLEEI